MPNTKVKQNTISPYAAPVEAVQVSWAQCLLDLARKPSLALAERAWQAVQQACEKGTDPVLRGVTGISTDPVERLVLAALIRESLDPELYGLLRQKPYHPESPKELLLVASLVQWLTGGHSFKNKELTEVTGYTSGFRGRGLVQRQPPITNLGGSIAASNTLINLVNVDSGDKGSRVLEPGMTLEYPEGSLSSVVLDEEQTKGAASFLEMADRKQHPKILLFGRPGTGKTELGKALCTELKRPVLVIESPDKFNESGSFLKRAFLHAAANRATIYIDECSRFMRGDLGGSLSNEAGTLLTLIEDHKGPIIAMTNRFEDLFNAYLRRFVVRLEFGTPLQPERQGIWKKFVGNRMNEKELREISKRFSMTGGQIRNAVMAAGDHAGSKEFIQAAVDQIVGLLQMSDSSFLIWPKNESCLSEDEINHLREVGRRVKGGGMAMNAGDQIFYGGMSSGFKVLLEAETWMKLSTALQILIEASGLKGQYIDTSTLCGNLDKGVNSVEDFSGGLEALVGNRCLPVFLWDGLLPSKQSLDQMGSLISRYFGVGVIAHFRPRDELRALITVDQTITISGKIRDNLAEWAQSCIDKIETVEPKLSARGVARMIRTVHKSESFDEIFKSAVSDCVQQARPGKKAIMTLRHVKLAIRSLMKMNNKKKISSPVFGR